MTNTPLTNTSREHDGPRIQGKIVLVGDDAAALTRMAEALRVLGETIVIATTDAPGLLSRHDADVIIADDGAGEARAHQLLVETIAFRPAATRILLASGESARDQPPQSDVTVLAKPVDLPALHALCTMALRCTTAARHARELAHQNRRLRGMEPEPMFTGLEEVASLERHEGILTRSPAMKQVLAVLPKLEESDGPVVIHGESGSGKELVAEAIHARSRRGSRRFVAVNLGALSDARREAELFGQPRGPFMAPLEARAGRLAEADGGTIFLDEVAAASPALQAALLRVLEDANLPPVGAERPRRVDVRVIAATTRNNLEDLVRQGLFRRDLYDRLRVSSLHLPALRDRPEDIFPLAKHFVALASLAMGRKPPGISREARAVLESYPWEGNLRELRNVMERAAILCKSGLVIAADLPFAPESAPAAGADAAAGTAIVIPAEGTTLKQLERQIFQKTLTLVGGNQSRAAQMLGLCESTFRFRLHKLGIASRRARTTTSQPPTITPLVARA